MASKARAMLYLSSDSYAEALTPDVTVFGDRTFIEKFKVK